MDFSVGDHVVHWTFGLGKIIGVEERLMSDQKVLFYLVQVRDLTVCVPVDSKTESRLRSPTPAKEFKKLFTILTTSGEPLSENRHERKSLLRKDLTDGKVETVCQVIRDLSSMSLTKSLNDDDKNILRRARNLLCAEWGFAFSIPPSQAESELQHILVKDSAIPVS